MTTPLTSYAKALVGAVAAVIISGITAWQATTTDGWRWVDVFPVAAAVGGAFMTYLVPEVPELNRAKSWIAAGFAVLTAVGAAVADLSPKASAMQIVFAVLGVLVLHFMPNYPYPQPSAQPLEQQPAPASWTQPIPVPPAPKPTPAPRAVNADPTADALAHLDQLDAEADDPADTGSSMAEPVQLPIEAEAAAAAAATQPRA